MIFDELSEEDKIVVELRAKVMEYEHALKEVTEAHDGACKECQIVAQGALDGLNREMCLEMVLDP